MLIFSTAHGADDHVQMTICECLYYAYAHVPGPKFAVFHMSGPFRVVRLRFLIPLLKPLFSSYVPRLSVSMEHFLPMLHPTHVTRS